MRRPCFVGIAGGTGSGKTWLADYLRRGLGRRAAVISHDWYYRDRAGLSATARKAVNFDHPRALETALLVRQLDALGRGDAAESPRYHFATSRRAAKRVKLNPAPVLIVEGLFVLYEKDIRNRLDVTVFVETAADIRLVRRIRRDAVERSIPVEETLRLYESFARPMHDRFVAPSSAHADHVWRTADDRQFPRRLIMEIKQRLSA
jgi:uridine kinase